MIECDKIQPVKNLSAALPLSIPSRNAIAFKILGAISLSHFLNDIMQSLMLAIYPLFKSEFHLDFAQVGLITMAFQVTASLPQPLIGNYTEIIISTGTPGLNVTLI